MPAYSLIRLVLGRLADLAGRANIAHARRDLLNHNDAFAVYGI